MSLRVLTVGHSNHTIDHFVGLLRAHEVAAVADVRSAPVSKYAPQFDKVALKAALGQVDIEYAFLGRELGARTSDRSCYVDGRVQYPLLARTETFKAGIARLLAGAEEHCVATMCSEKDPLDCHRTLLVARALIDGGSSVDHILADGRLESNDHAMARLLEQKGLDKPDLFRTPDELLEEALHLQEQRIAYVDQNLVQPAARETTP